MAQAIDERAALALWEAGLGLSAAGRARLIREAVAGPDAPVGDADRAAWAWRAALAPGPAEAVATCAACGEELELSLPADFGPPARVSETAQVEHDGAVWSVRLPTPADFNEGHLDPARLAPEAPWSDAAFVAAAEAALEAADPGMDVRVTLACAACGAEVEEPFDPATFLWAELDRLGRRVVADVARLARVFGWTEAEVLSIPPVRRALYLSEAET